MYCQGGRIFRVFVPNKPFMMLKRTSFAEGKHWLNVPVITQQVIQNQNKIKQKKKTKQKPPKQNKAKQRQKRTNRTKQKSIIRLQKFKLSFVTCRSCTSLLYCRSPQGKYIQKGPSTDIARSHSSPVKALFWDVLITGVHCVLVE